MRHIATHLLVLGLLCPHLGIGQNFLKVLGDPARAEAGSVTHISAFGEVYVAGSVSDSALVQRIDIDGNVIWSRAFKPVGQWPSVVLHLSDAPDGTIVGCGSGLDASQEFVEGFHFKMDNAGTLLWLRSWTDPAIYARRILAVDPLQYIVFAGVNDVAPPSFGDAFNARIDPATGDVLGTTDRFEMYPPSPYSERVSAVVPRGSKFYGAYAVSTSGAALNGRRVGLSKFDAFGQVEESGYLVFPNNVDRMIYPTDIVLRDDSLTIAYYGDVNGSSSNWTVGLIRCDTLGNIGWARDYNIGGSPQEHGTKLISTSFGYVLAGRMSGATPNKLFLLAISPIGDQLWCRSYGGAGQSQILQDILASNASDLFGLGFLITAAIDQGGGDTDILLIRTDVDGQIQCDQVIDHNSLSTILPTFNFPQGALPYPFFAATDQTFPSAVDAGIDADCIVEVSLGNDTAVCGTLTLDAGIPNAAYEWFDGSTAQTLDVTTSGTYWVRVYVGCCSGTDTIEVSTGELPGIQLGADTVLCAGATIELEPATGTWTFTWSDGSTGDSLIVDGPGTYWFDAAEGSCTATDTIIIAAGDLPTLDLGSDTLSCDGEAILLVPVVTDVDEYDWSDGSDDEQLLVEASATITLEVSNGCGSVEDEVEVTILGPTVVDLGPDTLICGSDLLALSVDLPDWSITWSDGTTGAGIDASAPGTYWVDATLLDCAVNDTIVIGTRSLPSVELGADTSDCIGEEITLEAVLVDAGSISWSNGSTDSFITVVTSDTYFATATNVCGSSMDSISVDFIDPLPIELGPDTTLCGTDSLILDLGSNGASLIWRDGSTDPVFIVTGPAHYWVSAELQGCTDRDTVDVDYDQLAEIDLGEELTLCTVPAYTLDAGPEGDDAVWQDGTVGRTYVVEETGRYIATITNYCGAAADTVQVNFAVPVEPLLDVELCAAQRITLDPVGDLVEVRWTTGDTTDAIIVGEGNYGYEATDIYGCEHADFVTIHWLEESDGQFMIPTAFTPNGDEVNEEFLVYGAEAGAFELVLFDRWGEEIYRADDPLDVWDGTSGGKPVPDGVYMYTVTYQDRCTANNTQITTRGHVTVLR